MPKVLQPKEMRKCLGCFTCMSACSTVNHKNHSLIKSAIKIRTSGGMSSGFLAIICFACKDPACMEVCPSHALEKRKGGGVLLTEEKCIGCRKCENACIVHAVNFDQETQKPIICHHCGLCAHYCPHDCLILVEAKEDIALTPAAVSAKLKDYDKPSQI
ncbi:MAG: 4Fe-4S binding protein [Treponema sp.]|nr:4Fe-4S binding protein [Treponema sp.]